MPEDALLCSILSDPDDDTVRLAYADCLADDPVPCARCAGGGCDFCRGTGSQRVLRAEFIRLQIRYAEVVRDRADCLNHPTDWRRCTEGSARWCPNCGDCTCRAPEKSLSDAGCPLHDPDSNHDWYRRSARAAAVAMLRYAAVFAPDFEPPHDDLPADSWLERIPVKHLPPADTPKPVIFGFGRGFVREVCCSYDVWEKYADAWYWHPDQEDLCPLCRGAKTCRMCHGTGQVDHPDGGVNLCPEGYDDDDRFDAARCRLGCVGCDGEGWVRRNRPCPPTAHPIQEVFLRTWPTTVIPGALLDPEDAAMGGPLVVGGVLLDMFCRWWPTIKFTLPEV